MDDMTGAAGQLTEHSDELREFVQQVQQQAELDSYEEAHALSVATLNVLGQAISGGQAGQLAEWLPGELQDELAAYQGHAGAVDKRNFLEKVATKIYSVDLDMVEVQVAATLRVLRSSAPGGELDDTFAQLPHGLSELFE